MRSVKMVVIRFIYENVEEICRCILSLKDCIFVSSLRSRKVGCGDGWELDNVNQEPPVNRR